MWQVEREATNCCSGSAPGVHWTVAGTLPGARIARELDAVAEVDRMGARVGRVLELALQLPLDGCAVFGHGYIRNTPNFVSSIGAFSEAEIASPSSRRVSAGSTTPSSQSRALA